MKINHIRKRTEMLHKSRKQTNEIDYMNSVIKENNEESQFTIENNNKKNKRFMISYVFMYMHI